MNSPLKKRGVSSATALVVVVAIIVIGIAAGLTELRAGNNTLHFPTSNSGRSNSQSTSSLSSSISSLTDSTSTTVSKDSVSSSSSTSISSSSTSDSSTTSSSSTSTSSSSLSSTSSSSSSNYHIGQENRTYFAGYEALPLSSYVFNVSASWVVPMINCAGTDPKTIDSYSFMWVGIDDQSKIEQIGTSSNCEYGSPQYYAWYAFWPSTYSIYINNVNPGDIMVASVSYNPSSFIYALSIHDVTNGWNGVTYTFTGHGGAPLEADWIVEQIHNPGVYPLTNFSSVTFSSCSMTQTYNGETVNGPITNDDGVTQISMVDINGNLMASTSDLSENGTTFTVTWVSGD